MSRLTQQQNPDGGWPYRRGGSWTEPTVYAVLALEGGSDPAAVERGLAWLRAAQRDDGGWPVRPGVGESSWVTALVALLPPQRLGTEHHRRAISWLAAAAGADSSVLFRVKQWLMGNQVSSDATARGWSWVAGTAAWVSPTSLAILALDRENRLQPAPGLGSRIAAGRHYLLSHECQGGGWNHGSTNALGYQSGAYPETTGMALAALRGVAGRVVDESLALALRFLAECHAADAMNWLRLGLAAHGRLPAGYTPPVGLACRTVAELATGILADRAVAGESAFWI